MRSAPSFENSFATQVHRPSLVTSLGSTIGALGGFVVCSFVSISFLGLLLFPPYSLGKLLGALVMLLIFAPLSYLFAIGILWYTRARLVLSPEGIAYQTIGYHLFAPWQQVAHVGYRDEQRLQRNDRIQRIEGLELRSRASLVQVRPWLPAFLPPFHQHDTFIPLSTISHDWQSGPLEQSLRRYAPQIFS